MTFTWKTPPWLRREDCSYSASTLTDSGYGNIMIHSEAVRGDDAEEALADLLMGPSGLGGTVLPASTVGVVVRQGVDLSWMLQPPIEVTQVGPGQWTVALPAGKDEGVSVFSASDIRSYAARLHVAYGRPA
ncbi:hypothetical protein [Streptomyces goshikiensis]|uniref:hypothetical protein n=1 Tax=Streptomyces goshikiensis TaxID=1942 RepID=UPI0036AEE36D